MPEKFSGNFHSYYLNPENKNIRNWGDRSRPVLSSDIVQPLNQIIQGIEREALRFPQVQFAAFKKYHLNFCNSLVKFIAVIGGSPFLQSIRRLALPKRNSPRFITT
ncbi:MAG: hypothetical protein AAF570_08075, partial [Bacteroidota bacterium]